jgi:4-amino-4-deoxy-L-arabinose transferase-like glycosyltransferase
MIQSVKELLATWNIEHGERAKLQHAYLFIAAATVVIAGLVGLIDDYAGQLLVSVALIALGIFVANVVVWALLNSLVVMKLPSRKPPVSRK